MHEATIANSILEIVANRLESVGPQASALSVEILCGEFRNVDPESLLFAFDSMKELHRSLADCCLEINIIPASAKCKDNDHVYRPMYELAYRCPVCDSGIGKLVQGEELDVVNVTIEVPQQEKEHARVTR